MLSSPHRLWRQVSTLIRHRRVVHTKLIDPSFDLFSDVTSFRQEVPLTPTTLRHLLNTPQRDANLTAITGASVTYDHKQCILSAPSVPAVMQARGLVEERVLAIHSALLPFPRLFASFFDPASTLAELQRTTGTTLICEFDGDAEAELRILGDDKGDVDRVLTHVQTRLMNLRAHSKRLLVPHVILDSLRRDNQLEVLQRETLTVLEVLPEIDAQLHRAVELVSAHANGTAAVEAFFRAKTETLQTAARQLKVDFSLLDLLTRKNTKYSTLKKIEALTSTTITLGTVVDVNHQCDLYILALSTADADEAQTIIETMVAKLSKNVAMVSVPVDLAYQLTGSSGLSVFDLVEFKGVTFLVTEDEGTGAKAAESEGSSGQGLVRRVEMKIQAEDPFLLEEVRSRVEAFIARYQHAAIPHVPAPYIKALKAAFAHTKTFRLNTTRDAAGAHTVNLFAETTEAVHDAKTAVEACLETLRASSRTVEIPLCFKETFCGVRKSYLLETQAAASVDILVVLKENVVLTVVGANAVTVEPLFALRLAKIAASAQTFTLPAPFLDAFLFHGGFSLGVLKTRTRTNIHIERGPLVSINVNGLHPESVSECAGIVQRRLDTLQQFHQVLATTASFAKLLIGADGARIARMQTSTNCSISITNEIHVISSDAASLAAGVKLITELRAALEASTESFERM